MRGIVIALALAGAGCLGRYDAPTAPPPAPPAKSQPPPSTTPPQSPPPTPSPTPAPPQTPPAADGGTTPPPAMPDGGTSSACAQLDTCCQLLPPDQIQGCLDQLTGLDEQTCQGILDQLQSNGLCL